MAKVVDLETGVVLIEDTEDRRETVARKQREKVAKQERDWDPLSLHAHPETPRGGFRLCGARKASMDEVKHGSESSRQESCVDAIVGDLARAKRGKRRAREARERREIDQCFKKEIEDLVGHEVDDFPW